MAPLLLLERSNKGLDLASPRLERRAIFEDENKGIQAFIFHLDRETKVSSCAGDNPLDVPYVDTPL